MEQYRDQPQHLEKIAYQQRLLQEDLVHIRAEISRESTVCRGCGGWHMLSRPHSSTQPPAMGWAGGCFSYLTAVVELVAGDKSLDIVTPVWLQ